MDKKILLRVIYKSFYLSYQMHKNKEAIKEFNYHTLPFVVNGAFAAETALKCVLSNNDIPYPGVHTLRSLFEILPSGIKREMLGDLLQRVPQFSNEQIDKELYQISKAFEEWRYLGEYPNTTMNFTFFSAFIESVCTIVLKKYDVQINKGENLSVSDLEYNRVDAMYATYIHNHEIDMRRVVEKDRKKIQKLGESKL